MLTELRSDTFTKPGQGMLEAMMKAEVGDDVFGEDPSVNALQAYAANLFGMEAALFCPSGTMTNQIAINCHTRPGDEVICEESSHVYLYEGGGISFNSGCQAKLIKGDRGMLSANLIASALHAEDIHKPFTRLVCLENTSNRGGGSCYQFEDIKAISNLCRENNLALHLDGARVWNAIVNCNENPQDYGKAFDSISVCLSKGLGTPLGSLLIGDSKFIHQARRIRKVLGGAMRQAGYMAAAGLYALANNIERLEEDHRHAKKVADLLMQKDFVGKMLPVETNIIIFEVIEDYTARSFCDKLKEYEVLCIPISPTQVRMVFHLDVSTQMVNDLLEILDTF
ncbi:MAG: GntG family PLP-dependent aldolase [Ferruginibacter sp.]